MTKETWLDAVKNRAFIDYDGMGDQVTEDGAILKTIFYGGWITPSKAVHISLSAKYVLWYNR